MVDPQVLGLLMVALSLFGLGVIVGRRDAS